MHSSSFSVVVPVLNEAKALPVSLPKLLQNDEVEECLVVDGGSTDQTLDYLAGVNDPRLRVISADRGRGAQMNAGAGAARGSCLLFHHADTVLPEGAFRSIQRALDEGYQWGGFRQQFSESNCVLSMISALHNWRGSMTGVVYGDQSMFVTATLFREAGGFPEVRMEDLLLSDQLLEMHTQSCLLDSHVTTDSRKFKKIGEWRAFFHVVSILLRLELKLETKNHIFFKDFR